MSDNDSTEISDLPPVGYDRFPRQGSYLHSRAEVIFDYDSSRKITGTVVRDDTEPPGLALIKLDDGRVIRTTECQWRPLPVVDGRDGS